MNILGISAFYHDAAAALVLDGKIVAAAQEEAFTRKKHDSSFPQHAIKYCLDFSGLSIDQLDAVVFYDKPLLKFERLLETYYAFAPRGLASFIKAMPVWLNDKLFLKRLIHEGLKEIQDYDRKKLKLLFPEHHLSHAASAFYPSSFREAAILTMDGVGEWATVSICHGTGDNIKVLKELHFPHSPGLLYSSFTYFLGFRVNSGEYKLMGLAPYGNPSSEDYKKYTRIIHEKLVDIKPDGSHWLNPDYFTFPTGLRMVNDKKWETLFDFPRRMPEAQLEQRHCDLALAVQTVIEEMVLKMAEEARQLTGSENLCLAGGVALNCVANGKLLEQKMFKNIFIQPAAGDAGGALGAALAANHIYFQQPRFYSEEADKMQGAFLGPEVTAGDLEKLSARYNAVGKPFSSFDDLCTTVATLLSQGMVAGWFQGRMEFGPRALGNRSILADARNKDMQKKLNLKIKFRESFRPFAPAMLEDEAVKYFNLESSSPYMLLVAKLKEEYRNPLPSTFYSLPITERLDEKRSELQPVTHLDFSARIQTVHKETNERFWQLLHRFREVTGMGMLVNTSFNVRGEPIVCTAEDAYRCFMKTELDLLVINNVLFLKTEQPELRDGDTQKAYALD